MPIEKAINEGRFAYSVLRKSATRMDPPPFVPTLADLTVKAATAFERAFCVSPAEYRNRPAAAEWVQILSLLESELVPCGADPKHHHLSGRGNCPWCKLESGLGVTLFPVPDPSIFSEPQGSTFDLSAVLARINRVSSPGPVPDPTTVVPQTFNLKKSSAARLARRNKVKYLAGALIAAAATITAVVLGAHFAFVGVFLAGYLALEGWRQSRELQIAKQRAESDWALAVREWLAEVGSTSFEAKKDQLAKVLAQEYKDLPTREKTLIENLNQRQREIQLKHFLEGHLIARATIAGIGESRKTTLASYGIENASDVSYCAVRNVPGFGDAFTSRLVAWRTNVERRFVFNPSLGIDPKDIQKIRTDISKRRTEIEQALLRGSIEIERIKSHILTLRQRPTLRTPLIFSRTHDRLN